MRRAPDDWGCEGKFLGLDWRRRNGRLDWFREKDYITDLWREIRSI